MRFAIKTISKRSRSVISLLLAAMFLLGTFTALPNAALADEGAMMSGSVYWYYNSGNQTLSIRTTSSNAVGILDTSKGFGNGVWPWTGKSWISSVKTVYFYNPSNSEHKPITTASNYSLKSMFEGFTSLEYVDFGGLLDTSSVKDFSKMFKDCSSLTAIDGLNELDTSNAQDVQQMFSGCASITELDLSNWTNYNTLYNMQYFVRGCSSLVSFTLNNPDFITRTPYENGDGTADYSRNGCQLGGMFEGCNSLEYVDMSNITIGGRSDGSHGFGQGSISGSSNLNGLFQNRQALKTVKMNNIKVPGMQNFSKMFFGCIALETVEMNGLGKLYDVINMGDMFRNCESLTAIYLDGIDNSAIGPTNIHHSLVAGDIDIENARRVGAAEFARDLGLRTCTALRTLSVNGSKLWMVRNEGGTPGKEYYNAANDSDVMWWWYSGTGSIGLNGTQLNFTSSINGETYVLNKRDYVDLITDRDGKGIAEEDMLPSPTPAPTPEPEETPEPDETPEPEETPVPDVTAEPVDGGNAIGIELPTRGTSVPTKEGEERNLPTFIGTTDIADRYTNINIINGDLNPNGPGFIAPGVYEVTDEPWTEEHVDMSGSAYGIDFKGVEHYVEVNGTKITSYPHYIDIDSDGVNDIVIVKGTNNTYINTTKRGDWPTSGEYTMDLNGNVIAFIYKGAATEQGTNTKRDIRIEITKVTFKNLDRIPANPGRGDHDGNKYYDTNGGGEYFRTIAQANSEEGIIFRNYLKISDPEIADEGTSALSGGSGTDIDFTIKIKGAFSNSHFLFYADDLDVGEAQNWIWEDFYDPCFDRLPYENVSYGLGGESFVIHDSEEDVGPVRLAPQTGLIVITNDDDGSREVITTGSDPSTAWSEFSVLAKASGSKFTWRSGIGCSTSALRNAVTNKNVTEYVVYDFSNTLSYKLMPPTKDGVVVPVEEGDVPQKILGISNKMTKTTATTKTIGKFTFAKSGNDTIDIRIKGITNANTTLYALVQCDPKYSDAAIVWHEIVLVPATNVHYEESYLSYNSDKTKSYVKSWDVAGKALNPVYNASSNAMTGSGKNRQDDDNIVYGYDATYSAQTGDSNGRSMHVKIGKAQFDAVKNQGKAWPETKFTFTGTGFDIIGRTGLNTGVYVVNVKNSSGKTVKSQIINTRYFGSSWMGEDGSNGNIGDDLRQVPIVHIDSYGKTGAENPLPYDTYTVTVQFVWMKGQAAIPKKGMPDIPGIPEADYELIGFEGEDTKAGYTYPDYDIYVDAIRIYNPADVENPVVNAAYTESGELNAEYKEIRDIMIDSGDLSGNGSFEGGIAIDLTPHQVPVNVPAAPETPLLDPNGNPVLDNDGNLVYTEFVQKMKDGKPVYKDGEPVYEVEYEYVMPQGNFESLAAAYEQYGPNNEMYLTEGQGFAFKLEGIPSLMHISAKVPFGGSMDMNVYAIVDGVELEPVEFTITSATEMYYDCGSVLGGISGNEVYIVITASGSGILSLCEMKTVAAEGSTSPNIVADHRAIELAAAIIGGTKGDVNSDGSIDMMDALITMRAALGGELNAYGLYCADMNNDGIADMQDALAIMRKAFA